MSALCPSLPLFPLPPQPFPLPHQQVPHSCTRERVTPSLLPTPISSGVSLALKLHFLGSFRHLGKQLLPGSCRKGVAEAAPHPASSSRISSPRLPGTQTLPSGQARQWGGLPVLFWPWGLSDHLVLPAQAPQPSPAQPPRATPLQRLHWPHGAGLGLGWPLCSAHSRALADGRDGGGPFPHPHAPPGLPPGPLSAELERGPSWGPGGLCRADGQNLPSLSGPPWGPLGWTVQGAT